MKIKYVVVLGSLMVVLVAVGVIIGELVVSQIDQENHTQIEADGRISVTSTPLRAGAAIVPPTFSTRNGGVPTSQPTSLPTLAPSPTDDWRDGGGYTQAAWDLLGQYHDSLTVAASLYDAIQANPNTIYEQDTINEALGLAQEWKLLKTEVQQLNPPPNENGRFAWQAFHKDFLKAADDAAEAADHLTIAFTSQPSHAIPALVYIMSASDEVFSLRQSIADLY